ncbi:MAG: tetratricopeptide repeat protein [Polyangiaceae bacterium]
MVERILMDAFDLPSAEAQKWAAIPLESLPPKEATPTGGTETPDTLEALRQALDEAGQAQDYPRMIALVKRMIALEPEQVPMPRVAQERVARYHELLGQLAEQLGQHEEAIEAWNQALELDWTRLAPFEKIVRTLTRLSDWSLLERNYRRMLRRTVHASAPKNVVFELWRDLGNVYADRLKNSLSAIEAFRMALSMQEDAALRARLNELERSSHG